MQPRTRKIIGYLAGTFIGTVAIAAIVLYLSLRHFLSLKEEEAFDDARAARWASAVAADLDALQSEPLFRAVLARSGKVDLAKDAGTYLNPRLRWEGTGAAPAPVAAGLAMPGRTVAQLREWSRDWTSHASDVDWRGVDFGWMKALADFTYWDLEASGPVAGLLAKGAPGVDVDAAPPVPDLGALNLWVKLRLLSGMRAAAPGPAGADAVAALVDVERLATLGLTTGRVPPTLSGLAWLVQEARVAAKLQAAGVQLPPGVPLLAEATAGKAHRALWAEVAYVGGSGGPAAVAKVLPPGVPRFGACAALDERLPSLLVERVLLAAAYPERLALAAATVDQVAAGCRPSIALAHWRDPAYVPASLKGDLLTQVDPTGARIDTGLPSLTLAELQQIPWAKKTVGLLLAAVARPDAFEPYEQAAASPPAR